MALSPFLSNPSTSAASSSCFLHSPSPSFCFLLRHSEIQSSIVFTPSRFKISCSNNAIQVDTEPPRRIRVDFEVKKKRKPRPSFLEQIRNKWSIKPTSSRDKFPWQQQKQRREPPEEEEEEVIEQVGSESSVLEREPRNDATPAVRVASTTRGISAPWVHGSQSRDLQFDFNRETPKGEVFNEICENSANGVRNFDASTKSFDDGPCRGGESNGEIGESTDEILVEFSEDEEEINPVRLNVLPAIEERSASSENFVQSVSSGNDCSDPVDLPWKREPRRNSEEADKRRSKTILAEQMLPEHELRRLRNVSLRMLERIEVGVAGITQELVDTIHEKWKVDEVVKLKFDGPLIVNMKRAHETLENKTGGLVIWRSGSMIVLYRGMTYHLPCVQSFAKQNQAKSSELNGSNNVEYHATGDVKVKNVVGTTNTIVAGASKHQKTLSKSELTELNELNHLLDEIGPRFKDWSGCEPLPIDADLLPAVVPGYKPPTRLLPYGVRHCLRNKEVTVFRRLARKMPPHFALGRSRQLQGLANAMVQLWEKCAIAKIAIKRGVENTRNERMAEELKILTGGTLLSRNKEYIVFYRGNDYLPPTITEAVKERRKLADLQQEVEEQVRQVASPSVESKVKASNVPLVAGTLAETVAATSRWGSQRSSQDIENMREDSALAKLDSLIRYLEKKLALAKWKVKNAEKSIAKLQGKQEPADLPTDLETITDEERLLFRKIGLSMKPYLLLGRRGVYDGTIENMHLHWKFRELVKIIVRGKTLQQVKHIAISLEAESGGVVISLDKTIKGYAVIFYRGKNYTRPDALRPKNMLTRRQALARSIELQRREALKHHILDLEEKIDLLKSELEEKRNGK
ncbi:CRM-domain containing factor CFM3, chloroplastic/mitochondrial [Momordica charantia]|uniref:CRM-domain containing factor CFM3, chloroplastic/mitochondrial n=1 Tax=Momordica charantia TaxID=3673 RepID=A0A6J1D0M1_MOMCH|nr:CRM-domain containing factor CFM3, chloroplastic/mitochondrial [Momordica charantia]